MLEISRDSSHVSKNTSLCLLHGGLEVCNGSTTRIPEMEYLLQVLPGLQVSAISLGDWVTHDGHVVGSCLLIIASLKSGIKYLCKEDTATVTLVSPKSSRQDSGRRFVQRLHEWDWEMIMKVPRS